MPRLRVKLALTALLSAFSAAASAQAPPAPATHQVTFSGYVQPQYELNAQKGETTDRVHFRRIMLTLDGSVAPEWTGRVQVDLAPVLEDHRLVLKDVYVRYNGLARHGVTFTLGNQKTPYSRSLLVSSARRSLPERPVTGDRNFGAPGRAIGLRVDGTTRSDHIQWIASVASALHSPDATRVRIDGLAEAGDDWNQGVLVAGRIELHPFGAAPRDQGDFGGPKRLVLGVGGYVWSNDDDVNRYTENGQTTSPSHADVDTVTAFELSGGWRGARLSVDAEYHRVRATAIDPSFSAGLFAAGEATLHESGVEAGFMLLPHRLEALAAFDSLTATGHEATTWRPAVGAAYYVVGHTLKIAFMRRDTYNDPVAGPERFSTTFVTAQFAF